MGGAGRLAGDSLACASLGVGPACTKNVEGGGGGEGRGEKKVTTKSERQQQRRQQRQQRQAEETARLKPPHTSHINTNQEQRERRRSRAVPRRKRGWRHSFMACSVVACLVARSLVCLVDGWGDEATNEMKKRTKEEDHVTKKNKRNKQNKINTNKINRSCQATTTPISFCILCCRRLQSEFSSFVFFFCAFPDVLFVWHGDVLL